MKRMIFLVIGFLFMSIAVMAQAKKPRLMVVPSDIWCKEHGYVMKFNNQGTEEVIPDYNKAVSSSLIMMRQLILCGVVQWLLMV